MQARINGSAGISPGWEGSLDKGTTHETDGLPGGRSGPRIVVGDQRQQHLLADGRIPGPSASVFQPPAGLRVGLGLEDGTRDERCLQDALELDVGSSDRV